jgi:hypothetical protein
MKLAVDAGSESAANSGSAFRDLSLVNGDEGPRDRELDKSSGSSGQFFFFF